MFPLDPNDENYITRIEEDGGVKVIFGDGERGSRLPTGTTNVNATYRSGIGPDGDVDAGTLTILQSKPLGIQSVVNPLDAGGVEAPENVERRARERAAQGADPGPDRVAQGLRGLRARLLRHRQGGSGVHLERRRRG